MKNTIAVATIIEGDAIRVRDRFILRLKYVNATFPFFLRIRERVVPFKVYKVNLCWIPWYNLYVVFE